MKTIRMLGIQFENVALKSVLVQMLGIEPTNNSFNNDCKGRSFLRLGLLPKIVQFQLCATRGITGMAGIPINMLRLEQLMEWHKGTLAYSLAAC